MNEKARLWGLRCTRFASSHGLEDGNRSCAADLAVLTRLAMREPRIARIVRRPQASFRFPIKGGRLFLAGPQPAAAGRLPRGDRAQDGLHRRRRALLRRRRAPRRAHARGGAAELAEPAEARRRSCWTSGSVAARYFFEVAAGRRRAPRRSPRSRRPRKPVNGSSPPRRSARRRQIHQTAGRSARVARAAATRAGVEPAAVPSDPPPWPTSAEVGACPRRAGGVGNERAAHRCERAESKLRHHRAIGGDGHEIPVVPHFGFAVVHDLPPP